VNSNPLKPTLVCSCDTSDVACGVAVQGNYAYVALGKSGLAVIDITDPNRQLQVGSPATSAYANDVTIAGGYAYVAVQDAGIDVKKATRAPAWIRLGWLRLN
jgi:hypothetical protein